MHVNSPTSIGTSVKRFLEKSEIKNIIANHLKRMLKENILRLCFD